MGAVYYGVSGVGLLITPAVVAVSGFRLAAIEKSGASTQLIVRLQRLWRHEIPKHRKNVD